MRVDLELDAVEIYLARQSESTLLLNFVIV